MRFSAKSHRTDADTISKAAQEEFDQAVELLRGAGVTVHVFEDTASPEKPDAVFPNNWFSTHHDGRVALYPMYSPTRRNERRRDVIDELGKIYRISALVDYSSYEQSGLHLEGTGSLVLDYVNRIAYVSLSQAVGPRSRSKGFARISNFEPMTFRERERRRPSDLSHERCDVCRFGVCHDWLGHDRRSEAERKRSFKIDSKQAGRK